MIKYVGYILLSVLLCGVEVWGRMFWGMDPQSWTWSCGIALGMLGMHIIYEIEKDF